MKVTIWESDGVEQFLGRFIGLKWCFLEYVVASDAQNRTARISSGTFSQNWEKGCIFFWQVKNPLETSSRISMALHGFSKAETSQFFIRGIKGYGDTGVQRCFQKKYKNLAPIHVRQHLDQKLKSRRSGRGGPVPWQPRSSGLTPRNFFLWKFIKNGVLNNFFSTIPDLKSRIRAPISSITEDTLQKVDTYTIFRIRLLLR